MQKESFDPMLNSEILTTFRGLLDEAIASPDREPTAMNLATVDAAVAHGVAQGGR